MTITELVRKYGRYTTRKGGEELIFECPSCHHVKFEVNVKKNVFHCFRCGASGKVWPTDGKKFYAEVLVKKDVKEEKPCIDYKPLAAEHYQYLASRGIDFIRAGDIRASAGYGSKLQRRVIIPIVENGKIVTAVARALDDRKPKELFLGEHKGNVLYNLDEVDKKWMKVIITEGVFDAEMVIRAGFTAVAVMGSNMTDVQAGKLLSKRPAEILIMLDNDAAGRAGAIKIHALLRERFAGYVGIVGWKPAMFNGYKDPGDCPEYIIKEIVTKNAWSSEGWARR